jgi:hypothetical protein
MLIFTVNLDIAQECTLWGKYWGFEISDIKIPDRICVWHGEKDFGTTIGMGEYISKQIKCRFERISG